MYSFFFPENFGTLIDQKSQEHDVLRQKFTWKSKTICDPQVTQTIELANKDLKTVIITIFNTVRKVEEILSMLNRALEENLTDTIADTFSNWTNASSRNMKKAHSSVLAWRIPGTGEPGGRPSMGSHRVGHDWNDLAAVAAGWSPRSCIANKIPGDTDAADTLGPHFE